MGNQICAGKVKVKKREDNWTDSNSPTKQNTVAPDTQHTIGESRHEVNLTDGYLKPKQNMRGSAVVDDSKHEESKLHEEEERKMQFNGFESYTMKDSYKNLQDLDSMILSGKKEQIVNYGHKATEARISQYI